MLSISNSTPSVGSNMSELKLVSSILSIYNKSAPSAPEDEKSNTARKTDNRKEGAPSPSRFTSKRKATQKLDGQKTGRRQKPNSISRQFHCSGTHSLTPEEEFFLLYLYSMNPGRSDQSYVDELLLATGTEIPTAFVRKWKLHRLLRGQFSAMSEILKSKPVTHFIRFMDKLSLPRQQCNGKSKNSPIY